VRDPAQPLGLKRADPVPVEEIVRLFQAVDVGSVR